MIVYALMCRANKVGGNWKLDTIHQSLRLALLHAAEYYDEGYDIKVEEHEVQ